MHFVKLVCSMEARFASTGNKIKIKEVQKVAKL